MIAQILVGKEQKEIDVFILEYQKRYSIRLSNVRVLSPVKDELSIDEIRKLRREFVYGSSEPVLYVLYKFDSAAVEAQSALLKSLEEKKEWQHFLLIAQSVEKIIPTIRSRSKTVELQSAHISIGVRPEVDIFLSELATAKNIVFLGDKLLTGLKKGGAIQFVDEIILYYRSRLSVMGIVSVAVIKKALHVKSLLYANNAHVQLAVDNLLIFCWKKVSMNQGIKI